MFKYKIIRVSNRDLSLTSHVRHSFLHARARSASDTFEEIAPAKIYF